MISQSKKTNPIQTQFPKGQNERKLTYNKGLQKKRWFRSPKKQTQFKADFRKAKMNLNFYLTKDYENVPLRRRGENKPNQSQFQTGLFSAKTGNFFPKNRRDILGSGA